MEQTQKLHEDDVFLKTSTPTARSSSSHATGSGREARRWRGMKRPRGKPATTEPLDVLGDDEGYDEGGGEQSGEPDPKEDSGKRSTRGTPRSFAKLDHKALAALLAAQPRTLRQDVHLGGATGLDSAETEAEEEEEADDSASGQPLLGTHSESSESGATKGSDPMRAGDGKGPSARSEGSGRSAEESHPHQRASVSPQAITTSSSGKRRKQESAGPTRTTPKLRRRLGALAVPSHPPPPSLLLDVAGDGGSGRESAGGGGWAAVLRGHQGEMAKPVATSSSAASSALDGSSGIALSKGLSSALGRDRAQDQTEAFLETMPARQASPSQEQVAVPSNRGEEQDPAHVQSTERDYDSPALIPQSRGGAVAGQQQMPTAGAGATLVADNLTLLTPSLRPDHAVLGGSEGGVSPMNDGDSPQPLDAAQTLAVYDLSLRPDLAEGESPHGRAASSEGKVGRELLLVGQSPQETMDDGCYKGGDEGMDLAVAGGDSPGEEADQREGSVAKDGDDTDGEETPLFAPVAPRASREAVRRHSSPSPPKRLVDDDAGAPQTPPQAPEKNGLVVAGRGKRAAQRGAAPQQAISVSTTPEAVPVKGGGGGRKGPASSPREPRARYVSGMRVQSRWGALWYDAVVVEDESHGYVRIRWDEDGSFLHVRTREVRPPKGSTAAKQTRQDAEERARRTPPSSGKRVKKDIRLATASRSADKATSEGPRFAGEQHEEEEDDDDVLMMAPRHNTPGRPAGGEHSAAAAPAAAPPAIMTGTQLVQLVDMEDEIEAQVYTPEEAKEEPERKEQSQQLSAAAAADGGGAKTSGRRAGSNGNNNNNNRRRRGVPQQPPSMLSDSQRPLFTGTSPEKQRMFVATQNLCDDDARNEDSERRRTRPQASPSVHRSERQEGTAGDHGPGHAPAQVHRRLAQSLSPSARPDVGASPSAAAKEKPTPEEEQGEVTRGNDPQFPHVCVGEDYYFRLPVPTALARAGAAVTPTILLGRVVAVRDDGGDEGGTGVVLQVYEMKHVTMRQNPRTGALEQQTTVYLGPRQVAVPVPALLFDTPVFVLSSAAMKHVFLLEDEGGGPFNGMSSDPAAADRPVAGWAEAETQRVGVSVGSTGLNERDSRSRPPSSSSSSSTESYFSTADNDNATTAKQCAGREAEDVPVGASPPQPHRSTLQPPPPQQVYGNTFPLPTPHRRPPRQAHGISLSLPLVPRSGSVLDEIVVNEDRPVRPGMIVAFRNPYTMRSSVALARSSASFATPLSSPTPSQRPRGDEGGVKRERMEDGGDAEEGKDNVLYGKVQMLRQVNGSAVLVVHTMAHNSVFGGSKMHVITPDMILDVS